MMSPLTYRSAMDDIDIHRAAASVFRLIDARTCTLRSQRLGRWRKTRRSRID